MTSPTPFFESGGPHLLRVSELANQCGVTPEDVLAAAATFGISLRSAMSPISPGDADRIRVELHRIEVYRNAARRPPEDKLARLLRRPRTFQKAQRYPIEHVFGNDQESLTMARTLGLHNVVVKKSEGSHKDQKSFTIRELLRQRYPNLSEEAARYAARKWADALFDRADVLAWLDAGIGPHDYAIAEGLSRHRVRPDHLGLVVGDRRVAQLVLGGDGASAIAELLRRYGHL